MAKSDYVVLGKTGKPWGIQGWLRVFSFTEVMTDILDFDPWYVSEGRDWRPIAIRGSRPQGKSLVVHFAGYDTPEKARLLTGREIAVKRSQLPTLAPDVYYWNDLVGLMVIDRHGTPLGPIQYLMETGSNDVIVIKHEGKEHAIPYLPGKVVIGVDLPNRIMRVDWELI